MYEAIFREIQDVGAVPPDLEDDTAEGDPGKAAPRAEIKPVATFTLPLYLRVMANHTLRPVARRELAHYRIRLRCEYPRYEEEIQAKRDHTLYDEMHHLQYVDLDGLAEWRLRRCLRGWDFHKVVPGFTRKLIRQGDLLTDDSMGVVQALPPLVRKEISARVWASLGAPS